MALHKLIRCTLTVALVGPLAAVANAQAHIVWTVDRKASLAWWQVNPHFNQLWATTCPAEPSWRPGEGRSPGWNINPKLRAPKTGDAGVSDTVHVPLYPRDTVRSVCREAVEGRLLLPDAVKWRGGRGGGVVRAGPLGTGGGMRDADAPKSGLPAALHPRIRVTLGRLGDL